jgi:hypothetical protein
VFFVFWDERATCRCRRLLNGQSCFGVLGIVATRSLRLRPGQALRKPGFSVRGVVSETRFAP